MIKKLGFLFLLLLIPSSASAANFLAEKGSLVKFQTDSRVFFVSNEQGGLSGFKRRLSLKKEDFSFLR
jgi:hypothetical protein